MSRVKQFGKYRHVEKGTEYWVLNNDLLTDLGNQWAPGVCYQCIDTGKTYTRPLDKFLERMEFVCMPAMSLCEIDFGDDNE